MSHSFYYSQKDVCLLYRHVRKSGASLVIAEWFKYWMQNLLVSVQTVGSLQQRRVKDAGWVTSTKKSRKMLSSQS
jgi:hypothetical protein